MLAGTAVAQAIPLIASPLLSRLYSPESFGALSTFVALSGLLALAATARYELAIILPKRDEDALALAAGGALLAILVCTFAAVIASAVSPHLLAYLQISTIGGWLYAIPLLALFLALTQIGSALATRRRNYLRIAQSSVTQQVIATLVPIVTSFSRADINGLILGRVVGVGSGFLYFTVPLRQIVAGHERVWRFRDIHHRLLGYYKFPLFSLPYSFLLNFSREFAVLAFNFTGQLAAAGQYALVRAALATPVSFLSAALSQVFYREAAERGDTREFVDATFRFLLGIAALFGPLLGMIMCWGPDLFAYIFGDAWREAGRYAVYLAVPTLLSVLTAWPERIYEVRGKQHWALLVQIIFDSASVLAVCLALVMSNSPELAIAAFALVQTLYHLTYLYLVFRLIRLPMLRYLMVLVMAVGTASSVLTTHWVALTVFGKGIVDLLAVAFVASVVAGASIYHLWRQAHSRPVVVGDEQ